MGTDPLVIDLHGDGRINTQGELIGNTATGGVAALAALDGNADGLRAQNIIAKAA